MNGTQDWQKIVEDLYQTYADGKLTAEDLVKLIKEKGLDIHAVIGFLDGLSKTIGDVANILRDLIADLHNLLPSAKDPNHRYYGGTYN